MTSTRAKTTHVVWSRLWRAGLVAAGVAAMGNALVYTIARALSAMPQSIVVPGPNGEGPVTLFLVVLMSVVPAVAATLLLALLSRFTPRPGFIFGILAALVFVGMFFGPLSIPDAPVGMIVALELMHVVAAAAITTLLLHAVRRMPRANSQEGYQ